MKIAVTAQKPGWMEPLDSRFGRASWFVIIDTETKDLQEAENLQNRQSNQGAGIQAARTIIDRGVEALISGNVGPKAFKVLQAAGVKMYRAEPGRQQTVADAFAAWERKDLEEISSATVDGHSI
jgi:predicted Fe-Mo cluster-binding NifX family protein